MRPILPGLLIPILLFGCQKPSMTKPAESVPVSPSLEETAERLRKEEQELFRLVFPEVLHESRFLYGTGEDAETILARKGSGAIVLGEDGTAVTASAVYALDSLLPEEYAVLYVNAQKERIWNGSSWKRFSSLLKEKMPDVKESFDSDEAVFVLFVKNGEVLSVLPVKEADQEALEEEMRPLAQTLNQP